MRRRDDEPVAITNAPLPRSAERRTRERRYLFSMGLRTLCFILAIVFMSHPVMWVFLAGAVFLPYVAVVLANVADNSTEQPTDFGYNPHRPALEGPGSAADR